MCRGSAAFSAYRYAFDCVEEQEASVGQRTDTPGMEIARGKDGERGTYMEI